MLAGFYHEGREVGEIYRQQLASPTFPGKLELGLALLYLQGKIKQLWLHGPFCSAELA